MFKKILVQKGKEYGKALFDGKIKGDLNTILDVADGYAGTISPVKGNILRGLIAAAKVSINPRTSHTQASGEIIKDAECKIS